MKSRNYYHIEHLTSAWITSSGASGLDIHHEGHLLSPSTKKKEKSRSIKEKDFLEIYTEWINVIKDIFYLR